MYVHANIKTAQLLNNTPQKPDHISKEAVELYGSASEYPWMALSSQEPGAIEDKLRLALGAGNTCSADSTNPS